MASRYSIYRLRRRNLFIVADRQARLITGRLVVVQGADGTARFARYSGQPHARAARLLNNYWRQAEDLSPFPHWLTV